MKANYNIYLHHLIFRQFFFPFEMSIAIVSCGKEPDYGVIVTSC